MDEFIETVTRKAELDSSSGDISYKYYFNKTECISTEITSKIAESYIGWDLISHDLSCAEEWILQAYQLLEPKDKSKHSKTDNVYLPLDGRGKDSIIMSLFISSVTYYGKCFAKAYGKGRTVKLESKDHVPKHLLDSHEKIIGFRNTEINKLVKFENPIEIDIKKNPSSSGSFIAVLNLTIDRAPTNPNDNAREDFTIDIIINVVTPTKIKTLPNCFLLEIEFPCFSYTYERIYNNIVVKTIFIT